MMAKLDWTYAAKFSPFLERMMASGRVDEAVLASLLPHALSEADFEAFAPWQQWQDEENEKALARDLRRLRTYVMAHMIVRDICRVSDLAEVTQTITRFADFAVNQALNFAEHYYQGLYGQPIGRYSDEVQHLSVVAMGKAGGYELNVSSDIDLIFVYPENGDTNGRREKSNQEFFTKVGQKLIALLNDNTEDGQVFRVDMRLRPDGDSGALVLSETALEQYLITQGREWERYAWCKARVVTPYAHDIDGLIRPFVFRKYLDFNAYEALRGLHRQIRQEVLKKGMADNVKLGAGGIREVEFVAQIFQMIRGGQMSELRLKGTQETLHQLAASNLLDEETVQTLLSAYRFLRDVEHRLQYWEDQQTQRLPENAIQQARLAESMGFADWAAFLAALDAHRQAVNAIFNQILTEPEESDAPADMGLVAWWQDGLDEEAGAEHLVALGYADAAQLAKRLAQVKQGSKYRHLSSQAKSRFDNVVPRFIAAAAECAKPDDTLIRLLDFLETIGRRSSYLAFLHEYPGEIRRLAQLMSQSAWLAHYLQTHPILLDELLSAELMHTDHDWKKLGEDLHRMLEAGEDTEEKMDILRRFQHAQIFRLAVQDLAGLWTVEALSDELSHLADTVLAEALAQAWRDVPKAHQATPQFAVIGYGKLGGKELGYASDLDLVYLYQDDYTDAPDVYGKLARRLTTWLSGSTGAGTLYETDLRLRPNGESGFLAQTVAAFEKYQAESAWTWEHQALTRARFICGDSAIGEAFEATRRRILTKQRDEVQLRQEVIAMREKMFATHPPEEGNVKYARGGVVDVEFIVQYWVLAKSREFPALLENYGNIALLNTAAQCGLISQEAAAAAANAYRTYRHIQHNKKLRDTERVEISLELRAHYQAVKDLWANVFGEEARSHL